MAARKAVEAALTDRANAEAAELGAATARTLALVAAVRGYNELESKLKLRFPGKKSLVKSFFPKTPRREAPPVEETVTPPTAAAEAAAEPASIVASAAAD